MPAHAPSAAASGGAAILPEPLPGLAATPAVVDQIALARLYGEPLFALPQDLYIPPDALAVFLEAFEGPLDLLLYLIRKQNFDILDIPLAEVTRQYLGYVEQVRSQNLELAAEYLLMAALLIEIKARLLLPPRSSASTVEAEADPRAELVRRLLEYERIKLAAQQLGQWPQSGREFWVAQASAPPPVAPERLVWVSANELAQAWRELLARARLTQQHPITRERLSVREHMSLLLRRLQGEDFVAFFSLLAPAAGVALLIVQFLALLELARAALVEMVQAEPYAPIYVRLRAAAA